VTLPLFIVNECVLPSATIGVGAPEALKVRGDRGAAGKVTPVTGAVGGVRVNVLLKPSGRLRPDIIKSERDLVNLTHVNATAAGSPCPDRSPWARAILDRFSGQRASVELLRAAKT